MSQLGEKTYMAISEIVKDEAISKFIKYYMDSTSGLVDHKQFVKELKKWKELKPETRSRLFYKRGGLIRYCGDYRISGLFYYVCDPDIVNRIIKEVW